MILLTTRLIAAKRSALSVPSESLPDDQGLSAVESQIDGGTRTLSNLLPTDARNSKAMRAKTKV